MKYLLILFLFVSLSSNATAALFDSSAQKLSSTDSAPAKRNSLLQAELKELRSLVRQQKNTRNANEAKELRAEINELKRKIKKQKDEEKIRRENEALNQELKEIKNILNEKDSIDERYSNNNTPNITIINSPTNNNTNTNTNSGGGLSSFFKGSQSKENRKHILSVGISYIDNFIIGDNFLSGLYHDSYRYRSYYNNYKHKFDNKSAPTISYSYKGDSFYIGAYYSKMNYKAKYTSQFSYQGDLKYIYGLGTINDITVNHDKLFGAKAGLNLYKNNFINLFPYVSINKVTGTVEAVVCSYNYCYSWGTSLYSDMDLYKTFTTVGLDALIDLNDSIAIKLGISKVLDKKSSFKTHNGNKVSSENSGLHTESDGILGYAGLAIKF